VQAVDYSFPERKAALELKKNKNQKKLIPIGKAMSKKRDIKEEAIHEKYLINWNSPGFRGHLLIRFLHLSPEGLYHDFFERVEKLKKDTSSLCKGVGIVFPKKTTNEAYQGCLIKIFDEYVSVIDDLSPQALETQIKPIIMLILGLLMEN
jgi:hypothetical protein